VASPRRSPAPEERRRDAERTRQALLDAAQAEFGAKGFAGARVGAIAERAAVNPQLISYYFGGKQGIYDALLARWHEEEAQLSDPEVSLAELVRRYLESGHRQPDLQRLFIRESLDLDPKTTAYDPEAPEVADLRRRAAAGELGADLDPAFVLLMMQAAVIVGTVFPTDVKRYLGVDPTSPEYLELASTQIRRLVRRLAADVTPPPEDP
jgi:TetR/AcrR family transcriptional regulator